MFVGSIIDYDIVLYSKEINCVTPKDENWNKGIVKFVILILMSSEPVYGNKISNEINEKTNGAWKPGPGSIYPALNKLISDGYAESYKEDGRVMYKITEEGRNFIKRLGEKRVTHLPIYRLMGQMWMQAMNPEDRGKLMLHSTQNLVSSLEAQVIDYEGEFKDKRELEVLLMNLEIEFEKALEIVRREKSKMTLEKKEVKF